MEVEERGEIKDKQRTKSIRVRKKGNIRRKEKKKNTRNGEAETRDTVYR